MKGRARRDGIRGWIGAVLIRRAILPGITITMAVTSFNLIGDGLRDAPDVRNDPI